MKTIFKIYVISLFDKTLYRLIELIIKNKT